MDKRVYGVLGISSIMANWNADFSGYPKTISDGTVFGSDKALKYPMKKMWENEGEKVLYIKSMILKESKGEIGLIPRSLEERYQYLFPTESNRQSKDAGAVLRNLMQTIDLKYFGATYAVAGNNLSITGAVQIGQGFNFHNASEAQEQTILSPFRDPSDKGNNRGKKKEGEEEKKDAKNSTLGTKIVSNEAHYFYPFAINPAAYKEMVELEITQGYTQEDYLRFKKAALCAATAYATNAKMGCENEFALFIETKQDLYLPDLTRTLLFEKGTEKGENKNRIHLGYTDLLNSLSDEILSVEIYYNPHTTIMDTDVEGAVYFDITTLKEV